MFRLEKDSNTLVIKLDGYQDNTVSVPVVKDKKDVHLSVEENLKVGDAVILTNDADESGDIWKHITKVSLKKPDGTVKNILPDGQESISEKIGYSISEEQENQLILGKDLFDTDGEYEVTIETAYYEKQTISFEISKADQTDPGETKEPPAAVNGEDRWNMGAYTFQFGTAYGDWIKNISHVSVNDQPYEKGNYVYGSAQYTISETDGFVMLGNQEITEDKNKIVISAAGYEDLTFCIDKTGKLVDETENPDTENKETLAGPVETRDITDGFGLVFDDAEWFDKITSVTVNETEYTKADYDLNSNEYRTSWILKQISLSNSAFENSEKNEIVIEAEGYESLTVTIVLDQNGKISDGSNGDIGNEDGEEKAAPEVSATAKENLYDCYTVTLSGEELDDWFAAMKSITINGTELTAVSYSWDLDQNKYLLKPNDREIRIGKNSLTESQNEIVISAGYEDLIFILDSDGALIAEEDSEAAIMLVSDEEEAEEDDRILDEDTVISDDSDEKVTDQDRMDSVEDKDPEDEKKQTDAAESKNSNNSKLNQLTTEKDAKEDAEEVKKDTLVDDDSSSEESQDPDTEDNKDTVAITEDKAEEQEV